MRKGILALVAFLLAVFTAMPAGAASDGRSYVTGYYGLELDGQFVGWLSSAEGGHATSDVVVEEMGADHIQRKHIAGVKYEDITVSFDASMGKPMYDWIKASFDQQYTRKNGAIIAADYNFKEISRLEFSNALISEIGFPALDAASKDAAKMTIKFHPEYTRYVKGDGSTVQWPTKRQKLWLTSNFRLRIEGLETSRVSKVEALVVKQKNVEHPVGQDRDYEQEPASLEIPNLVITVADTPRPGSQRFQPDLFGMDNPLYAWLDDFVIKGNNGEEQEKSGTIDYLATDGTVLFTLNLNNLGIFRVASSNMRAGAAQVSRVTAEMYCEQIQFQYGPAQTAAAAVVQ